MTPWFFVVTVAAVQRAGLGAAPALPASAVADSATAGGGYTGRVYAQHMARSRFNALG